MLVLLSGVSGVGKTVLSRELVEVFGCRFVPTWMTRPLRLGETEKVALTREEVAQKESDGVFFCVNEFYGNFYGLTKTDVQESLRDNVLWLLDRPLWALEPFTGTSYLNVVVLPQDESQLIGQVQRSGREDRLPAVLADYNSNYKPFETTAFLPPNVLVIVNWPERFNETAQCIYDWVRQPLTPLREGGE